MRHPHFGSLALLSSDPHASGTSSITGHLSTNDRHKKSSFAAAFSFSRLSYSLMLEAFISTCDKLKRTPAYQAPKFTKLRKFTLETFF